MKTLTLLFALLMAFPAWAGSSLSTVTISQTLTLTSPSAYISMTGVSATAYLKNIFATNISSTNSQATSLTVGTISGTGAYGAKAVFNGIPSPTTNISLYNVTSITKNSAGRYVFAGQFPPNTGVFCNAAGASGSTFGALVISSPTTTSATIQTYNTGTGGTQENNVVVCIFQ